MNQPTRPTKKHEINVAELRRRLGERRFVDVDYLVPVMEVIASRTTGEPVVGQMTIESIERGVSVRGDVGFDWVGDCRRCLEPVEGRIDVDFLEIFQVDAPDDSDIIELENDTIDLVPLVRDAVMLGLPLAPLCRAECGGPDPDRYPAKTIDDVEAEQAAAGPTPDPRWGALDAIEFD